MLSVEELKILEDLKKENLSEDSKYLLEIIDNLRQDQVDADQQQKAIFNILDDVNDSQIALNKKYTELEAIKMLVQNMGKSLDVEIIINNLFKTLKKIFSKNVNFLYAIYLPYSKKFSNIMYVDTSEKLGDEYLQVANKDMEASMANAKDLDDRQKVFKWFKQITHYKFLKGRKDNKNKDKPLSLFSLPLIVGGELLGVISVSSKVRDYFTKDNIDFINTSFEITVNTISRLRKLLKSETSRIKSLVENLSNGVIVFNLNLKVEMLNRAAKKMIRNSQENFIFFDLIEDLKLENKNINKDVLKMIKNGETFFYKEVKAGRFVYEITLTPIRDNNNNIISGALLLHDITHFIEIDRMKTEFVSLASHQLRTPLTAVKLFVEMIEDQDIGKLNDKQKEYIVNIQKSTQNMINLVNDLLNISRIDTGRLNIQPQKVQFEELIQEIIKESEPLIKDKNIKIIFKKPIKKMVKIKIDKILIRQVVHNLITNAIKYSYRKTSKIIINLEKKGSDCLFSIKDQGIGISQQEQDEIFKRFFRAKNARRQETNGIGLGLYMAKMIIQALGGKIWFKSKEDQGTTFFISLPIKGVKANHGEKSLVVNV